MAREKTKNPSEMTVEEKLKSLYALQTILSQVDAYKIQRGELPLEVQDLEDEIEGLTIRIEKIQKEMEDLNREVSNRHATIESNNANIAKYKEQLNNVRNNREYDSLNKEIEFRELDNQLNEKKIREAINALEDRKNKVAESTQEVSERRTDLDLKKTELDDIISETKQEEDKLREKAKNLELTIEPRLLSAFKRIRRNCRNGLGIVYVQRDACGGCFNKIPPQRQLDVRMRKKVIVCEYCGRILVDPELAGVRLDKQNVEEKPRRRRSTRRKTEE